MSAFLQMPKYLAYVSDDRVGLNAKEVTSETRILQSRFNCMSHWDAKRKCACCQATIDFNPTWLLFNTRPQAG